MSIFQQLVDNPAQQQPQAQRDARLDDYRRIEALTRRPLVVYAADWLTPLKQQTQNFSAYIGLDYNDVLPFKELISSIEGPTLDVLIHSPGGLGEAAERLVKLLRGRFRDVRFIVPHSSMSAATMLCFSGNSIAMNEASALGPIDPQVGGVPARAIKKGFDKVKKAVGKTPGALGPYLPMLQKYDLHVFEICDNAEKLSKQLVRQWLKEYMFAGDRAGLRRVNDIVQYFATHDKHLSHVRGVGVDECIKRGLKIHDLRQDREFGDMIWSLWQRIEFFFGFAPALAKLFENSHGVSFVRMLPQQMAFQLGGPLPFMVPQPAPPKPDEQK